ncbi:hypothetical protein FIBSPDRAFT_928315 [Athelia psychrophila]|uniref:Uncharacterized protein n=1 Tax=Athelia psychrophila TaxID=1759441 RepID=A0A166QJL3_9AGAM|nr:hypothetical protein FIBSPDRAFT_928315 [Fibularhizoctonia sp. CBS 109695]
MGNASKFDKAAHVSWPTSADVHAGGCIPEIRHSASPCKRFPKALSCHARWRRAQNALLFPQRAPPSRRAEPGHFRIQTNASFRGSSVT